MSHSMQRMQRTCYNCRHPTATKQYQGQHMPGFFKGARNNPYGFLSHKELLLLINGNLHASPTTKKESQNNCDQQNEGTKQ